jgi:hypothetical protein
VRLTEPGERTDRDLLLGIAAGLEPRADVADYTVDGVVITRPSSWWNHTRCRTCGHTFRRGDRALVDSSAGTVEHLMPGLGCAADPDSPGPAGADDRAEFSDGLLSTWPANVPLTLIAPGDWRLPRPGSGWRAPTCLYCGHTFRVGEYVVACPCQPTRAVCGAAVHRDPASGLPCWDRWRPSGRLTVCPTTMAKL